MNMGIRKLATVGLLAWWFVSMPPKTLVTSTVGPFDSAELWNAMREWVAYRIVLATETATPRKPVPGFLQQPDPTSRGWVDQRTRMVMREYTQPCLETKNDAEFFPRTFPTG
jgi:hypothetical protein